MKSQILKKDLFNKYLNLLLKWNKTYNLTALKTSEEIREKHFDDSLSIIKYLPDIGTILDIGTGAGFPGIPIKIAKPELEITLLESIQKKCNFCQTVIRELGLQKIKIICGRAEDRKVQTKIGKFNFIISRATFSLKELIEMSLPYFNNDSKLISIKGLDVKKEIEEAKDILQKNNLKIELEEKYKRGTIIIIAH